MVGICSGSKACNSAYVVLVVTDNRDALWENVVVCDQSVRFDVSLLQSLMDLQVQTVNSVQLTIFLSKTVLHLYFK